MNPQKIRFLSVQWIGTNICNLNMSKKHTDTHTHTLVSWGNSFFTSRGEPVRKPQGQTVDPGAVRWQCYLLLARTVGKNPETITLHKCVRVCVCFMYLWARRVLPKMALLRAEQMASLCVGSSCWPTGQFHGSEYASRLNASYVRTHKLYWNTWFTVCILCTHTHTHTLYWNTWFTVCILCARTHTIL